MVTVRFRRTAKRWHRTYRETRMVARALRSPSHPILAHVVVTRRCNLACTYCNEFDDFSKPVPTPEMLCRIDQLAALGTTVITLTGGETLLHPDIEKIIERIRHHGILAFQVTNGYLLTIDRIKALNRAGLDHMQISVDNVKPDEVSKKSLKVLDQKLQWLAQYAEFRVSIHSVLGACTKNDQDALTVARRVTELGLISTAGIVHDETGQLKGLNPEQRKIIEQIEGLSKGRFSPVSHNPWRKNLINGLPNDWHCGAGGRHLYICENGLVHWCMAQRGHPAIPLAQYTREDIIREAKIKKDCAPYCTIFCIQRLAVIDEVRANPKKALDRFFPPQDANGKPTPMPFPVRMLASLFTPKENGARNKVLEKTALRILKLD
jgi:MoaA/NifB/PqqE/SkfB family radical SAM enzyme